MTPDTIARALAADPSPLARLAEADLADESGQWELAAWLRLSTWHQHIPSLDRASSVYIGRGAPYLLVGQRWEWRPSHGWRVGNHDVVPAARMPGIRAAVDSAVRQALAAAR